MLLIGCCENQIDFSIWRVLLLHVLLSSRFTNIHEVHYFGIDGRLFQPSFCVFDTCIVSWKLFLLPIVNSMSLWSLWVCILSTFYVLVLANDRLAKVKWIIELLDPLLNVLIVPLLSITMYSLRIDSRRLSNGFRSHILL